MTTHYYERHSWQQKFYIFRVKDFCSTMYKQYYPWYDFWLQYVTNWDEVKDNCLNVPGVGCESRSN